jgi:hypothetical protein
MCGKPASAYIGLVLGFFWMWPSGASACFYTEGKTIGHVGKVLPQFREPGGPTAVGFKYSYVAAVGLLDFWTWDGEFCGYEGGFQRIDRAEAARLLGIPQAELGKPFLYRFPLGLIIFVPLIIYGIAVGWLQRKGFTGRQLSRRNYRARSAPVVAAGAPDAEPGAGVPLATTLPTTTHSSMPDANLPRDVEDLGAPIAEFGAVKSLGEAVGLAFLFGLLGVVAVFLSIGLLLGRAKGGAPLGAAIGLAVVLAIIAGLWLLLRGWRNRRKRKVLLCPNGLALLEPGRTRVIPWEAITGTYHHSLKWYVMGVIPGHESYDFRLECADGTKVTISEQYKNVKELAAMAQQEITRRQLPMALRAIQRGEAVAFGSLHVSKEGLDYRGETLPWEEVEALGLENGQFVARKLGQRSYWYAAPTTNIPNLELLLQVLNTTVEIGY